MKRISAIIMLVFFLLLPSHPVFSIQYCVDFLEYGNPGGWDNSLKTCDETIYCTYNYTYLIDVWLNDVPEPLLSAGFYLDYDPSEASILEVKGYDGSDLPGPWQPPITAVAEPDGPGTYFVATYNLDGAELDAEGDIIVAQFKIRCNAPGYSPFIVSTVPVYDTVVGESETVFDPVIAPLSIPLTSSSIDYDGDGLEDWTDNCPYSYNPFQMDCDSDGTGDICDADTVDTYPPNGNNCGNACECEGNFDIDDNVDGSDASAFKRSFGRNSGNRECTNDDPCKGDFLCDGDVDGADVSKFKSDFGRNVGNNPCPSCHTEPWCNYI